LSWGWLVLFSTSLLLWIMYGIILSAPPIIMTNVSIVLLLFVLVYLKIKYN
jgi:uncharacterized protein with PQ loop repeat